ncbi:amidase [Ottowia thiooxydans]|uniref:amidase n=1 Tax=Ottowia thiooxydans TaxID=219182 RepID=UPI000408A6B3|nr:amidase [Ottowia thiooxydans]
MHSISDLVRQLDERTISAVSLLKNAQQQAIQTADLNALAYVDWDAAHAVAVQCDAGVAAGNTRGALRGIPISIKDLYPVRGMPTRAGTRAALPIDAMDVPANEAVLVTRLRAAGAVIFGKTNMHEIALGSTGENVWTGDVKNPFNPLRQAGGSSSGSGVAVATGVGVASIGSDTGGSVRIPANFSGVTGFKPTHGAIPLEGALHLSWTCDHAGPLAHSVADCALLFEVMAGRSVEVKRIARVLRFAVPASWLRGRLSVEVREHFEQTLKHLAALGAELVEVATPQLPRASQCFTDIVQAEAAWVHRDALEQGGGGFSELVMPPLQRGQTLKAGEYIDALHTRAAIADELDAILAGCDAMLLPTAAVVPPLRGQTQVQVESGSTTVREAVLGQTLPFSLAGVPALSIPTGLIDGLPVSLQVVAARGTDDALLHQGQWLQEHVGKRLTRPAMR